MDRTPLNTNSNITVAAASPAAASNGLATARPTGGAFKPTPALPAERLLSLLGGRVRLAILRTLAAGPSHVGGIAESVHASIGLVSHNLRQLRDAGLVERTAKARERIYTLASGLTASPGGTLKLQLPTREGGLISVQLPPVEPALIESDTAVAHRTMQPGVDPTVNSTDGVEKLPFSAIGQPPANQGLDERMPA